MKSTNREDKNQFIKKNRFKNPKRLKKMEKWNKSHLGFFAFDMFVYFAPSSPFLNRIEAADDENWYSRREVDEDCNDSNCEIKNKKKRPPMRPSVVALNISTASVLLYLYTMAARTAITWSLVMIMYWTSSDLCSDWLTQNSALPTLLHLRLFLSFLFVDK